MASVQNVTDELVERELAQMAAQETVVIAIFGAVEREMKRKKISKTRVAKRLGITEAKVNKLLAGRNITLRTLGNLLWAVNAHLREVKLGSTAA